jgi:cytochrome P450
VRLAGVALPKGARLALLFASANHDEKYFPDAARFDLRHDHARSHLAFGHGIHYCLGAPLARLEAGTAIRTLLERAPGLASDGPPGDWLPGMLMRGVRSLPVRW